MADHLWTALVSLLALLTYFSFSMNVAKARSEHNTPAPAMSGPPEFERAFRIQLNTLEWLPIFLVSLWLFAFYVSDMWGAALGVVWIIGRLIYFVGYSRAAAARAPGFLIQSIATAGLLFGALGMIVFKLATHTAT